MIKLLLATLSIFIMYINSAKADEYTMNLAPAWWEYQEKAPNLNGFKGTPASSKANGLGVMGRISGEFDLLYDLKLKISSEGLFTLIKPNEYWFNPPASFQINTLSIQQWEIFTSISHKILKNDFNLWISYQNQKQNRNHFVGFPKKNDITETQKIIWGGIGWSKILYKDFRFSITSGIPIKVKVKNSLFGNVGNKRSGYRGKINISAPLPWNIFDGSALFDFSYEYKKVGGQRMKTTYWPKNTFQIIRIGILLYW